jgi:hypothetical protein
MIAALSFLLISGCATISEVTLPNRENLLKLNMGMTKQEVLNIMGTKPMEAYYKPGTYGKTVGVAINNPYRSEILRGRDEKMVEVLYYVTDDRNADGVINDNETTPMVFENGRLAGWGWNFLESEIKKYEIIIKKGG